MNKTYKSYLQHTIQSNPKFIRGIIEGTIRVYNSLPPLNIWGKEFINKDTSIRLSSYLLKKPGVMVLIKLAELFRVKVGWSNKLSGDWVDDSYKSIIILGQEESVELYEFIVNHLNVEIYNQKFLLTKKKPKEYKDARAYSSSIINSSLSEFYESLEKLLETNRNSYSSITYKRLRLLNYRLEDYVMGKVKLSYNKRGERYINAVSKSFKLNKMLL